MVRKTTSVDQYAITIYVKILLFLGFHISKLDIFQSFQTKEQYKINHKLNSNDKCSIYLLFCTACGLQYEGFTTVKFRFRYNNYQGNNQKEIKGRNICSQLFVNTFLQMILTVSYNIAVLTLSRMGISGAAHWWGPKNAHLLKICHRYPTMMKLGTAIPYLKKIQKYIIHMTHSLSSADISIFSPEISKFCYIKK